MGRHLVTLLVVIWLASTFAFFALRIIPGDAIQSQLLQAGASREAIEQRREEQGLNNPILTQYGQFLLELTKGNFGHSLINGEAVVEMIGERWLQTATLGFLAILVGISLGLALGIVTAISVHFWLSTICELLVNLSLSVPIYWSGTLFILFLSTQFPGIVTFGTGAASELLLPASVLGFHTSGNIARIIKTNIREVASADFVRTARAKGMSEGIIFRRHVLRLGLLSTITTIAVQFGFLLSGVVITESIFVRTGIGRLLLERTLQQDYPVVQGIVVMAAIAHSLINMLADISIQYIDPRVRVS